MNIMVSFFSESEVFYVIFISNDDFSQTFGKLNILRLKLYF